MSDLRANNQTAIDEFCDTLWLEDGLSRNTLDAYRRDMSLFSAWLESQHGKFPYIFTADTEGKIVEIDSPFTRQQQSGGQQPSLLTRSRRGYGR